jgi:recombination protein RecA
MSTTATIRTQIEAALAHKIPSALTPAPKMIRSVAETGIQSLDNLLQGGLPSVSQSVLSQITISCPARTSWHFTQA